MPRNRDWCTACPSPTQTVRAVLISQTDLFGHFETGPIRHDIDVGFEVSEEKEQLAGGSSYTGYDVVSSAGPQGFNGGDCAPPELLASHDCTSLYSPNPRDPWRGTITLNTAYAYYTTHDLAPYAFDTITLSRTGRSMPACAGKVSHRSTQSERTRRTMTFRQDVHDELSGKLDVQADRPGNDLFHHQFRGHPGGSGIQQRRAGSAVSLLAVQSPPRPASSPRRHARSSWAPSGICSSNHLLLSGDIFYEKHTDASRRGGARPLRAGRRNTRQGGGGERQRHPHRELESHRGLFLSRREDRQGGLL